MPLLMAFHHRKLLDDPPLPDLCKTFCVDLDKSNGTCPLPCYNICPAPCKEILSSLIFPPPPPPPPPLPPVTATTDLDKPPKLSLLLTASLAVLATAFFIFTCYTIYRFYTVWRNSRRRRRRRQPEQDGGSGPGPDEDFLDDGPVVDHPIWYIRTIGLQPSVINAIAIVKYKSADGVVEGTDCAVCLSEFEEDETLRLLPKCSHAFHIPCIDTWLASHTNCPMCRAGVVGNTAGPVAPQDPAPQDSGRAEEVRIEIEGGVPGRAETGPEMSENGDWKGDVGGLDGVQGVRRSVSMDSVSASMISAAVADALSSDNNKKHKKECGVGDVGRRSVGVNQSLLRLASIERCVQTGGSSSSIKRSASCSAKVFLSRHNSSSRS